MLAALRQLLGYLIFGLGLLVTPFGWYYLLHFPFINKNIYSFNIWYALDVLACTVCHKTHKRTISGWTGQHMAATKRYRIQATVIDYLFYENHCRDEYLKELRMGYVK